MTTHSYSHCSLDSPKLRLVPGSVSEIGMKMPRPPISNIQVEGPAQRNVAAGLKINV